MSNPNTPGLSSRALACLRAATPAQKSLWFRVLAGGALDGYIVFLAPKTTAVAGGSDSSGYLNSARLLAAGRLQAELRLPPEMANIGFWQLK